MHEPRRPWLCAAALLLGATLAAALAAGAPAAKRAQTETELKAVRAEIARIRAKMEHDQIETDRAARELRAAEQSVGAARTALDELHDERTARSARRAELAAQKRMREAEISADRATLASQLRVAYLIGREEPLKLLLNQQDPVRAGRMFAYYGYFGRARAGELERIAASVQALDTTDRELASEEDRLTSLESQRRADLAQLETARAQRGQALASLQAQSRTRAQALQRLQREQSGLETLLRELARAIQKFPLDRNDAFSQLRGKLAWPVSGQLVARFGEPRAGALKWDGVLVATERGAPVRAIYQGRVIFADWLPGLGLLTIVDHGNGYLSLYGHNDRLLKGVGDEVGAGDSIAVAGDSGGSARPELYFEIRKGGHPLDPRPWFSAAEPR